MKTKIKKLRSKLSANSNYSEESLEKIKDKKVYDLFTPDKSTLLCEDEELNNIKKIRFLEHKEKKNSDVVFFLVIIDDKYAKEVNPLEIYLRYNIEDPEIPHYPGGDFKMKVHNSEIIRSVSELKNKYNISREDLDNIDENELPALKIRTQEKDL